MIHQLELPVLRAALAQQADLLQLAETPPRVDQFKYPDRRLAFPATKWLPPLFSNPPPVVEEDPDIVPLTGVSVSQQGRYLAVGLFPPQDGPEDIGRPWETPMVVFRFRWNLFC